MALVPPCASCRRGAPAPPRGDTTRAALPAALTLVLALLALALLARPAQAGINIVNRCPFEVTAFARSGPGSTGSWRLAPDGGAHYLELGPTFIWPVGVIWASQSGNTHNGQATQVEFTIGGANGDGGLLDYYDISLVNGYNLPVHIRPINPPDVKGQWCGTPSCTIPDFVATCTAPNYLVGPDPACINTHGPEETATPSALSWKGHCPDSYGYSKDDESSVFACKWGTIYEVLFCPKGWPSPGAAASAAGGGDSQGSPGAGAAAAGGAGGSATASGGTGGTGAAGGAGGGGASGGTAASGASVGEQYTPEELAAGVKCVKINAH